MTIKRYIYFFSHGFTHSKQNKVPSQKPTESYQK